MEDLAQIKKHLATQDQVLKTIISEVDLPDIQNTHNVFHDLMSCLIEQQIHYRSTKKTFQKALQRAEIDLLSPQNFSDFEKAAFEPLKLSIKKYETIMRVLDFFEHNPIDWFSLGEEEVRQQLKQIKGIGPWTVDMILLYTLGLPNIFPADDYHLKQLMPSLYQLDTSAKLKAQMKNVATQWQPYQSIAVRYLWAWKAAQKKR